MCDMPSWEWRALRVEGRRARQARAPSCAVVLLDRPEQGLTAIIDVRANDFSRGDLEAEGKQIGRDIADALDKSAGSEQLAHSLEEAGARLFARNKKLGRHAGACLTATRFDDDGVSIAHIGDGVVFSISPSAHRRATIQHTLRGMYDGTTDPAILEALETSPGLLVRMAGVEERASVDFQHLSRSPGDMVVMTDGGLLLSVDDRQIASIASRAQSVALIVEQIAELAASKGIQHDFAVACGRYL
jgi:serine/threonine protein phosphatase PrpC